jgi:hypothetical protein
VEKENVGKQNSKEWGRLVLRQEHTERGPRSRARQIWDQSALRRTVWDRCAGCPATYPALCVPSAVGNEAPCKWTLVVQSRQCSRQGCQVGSQPQLHLQDQDGHWDSALSSSQPYLQVFI